MTHTNLVPALKGNLIVSVQSYPGEPMRDTAVMTAVARAVSEAGPAALRVQGLGDCTAIKAAVDLPLIGLWKDGKDGVVITPTLDHALAVARTGADVIALDATPRPRPDGRTFAEIVSALRRQTDALVMADCSTLEEGLAAAAGGADLIGTTLAGYTDYSPKTAGPDLELVSALAAAIDVPVIAEGRIRTPDDAAAALAAGAHAVVVGTAITHPTTITSWFIDALTPGN